MKNITRKIFGMLSTWLMVMLFISAAPFANAQETPDMVITGFLAADETPGLTNAYPGNVIFATVSGNLNFDFKTTPARYALVNQKCIDTQGQSGLNFPISSVEVTDDGVNKLLKIKATVPHNILKEEYKLQNLKVLCVTSGTVINLGGIFINSNVISENSEAKLYLTGGDKSGSNLNFYKAGPRHFTSPKFNISSITGSTLSYEIRRTGVTAPPEGSEILCEYSTNGETWIKFDTIKLDMGTAWPASVIEKDMIAGMVSANTQFRFRQVEETYAANTHPWEIRNFIVFVPSSNTNFEESAIATFTVNTPTYTVALTASGPFAVGSNVSVTYSAVNGKFPDKTKFEKILYNWDKSPNDFMHFGTANAPIDAGTVSIPLPFILYDDLAISLRAEGPEGLIHEATTVNFNSQPVSVAINEIVYTEPIEDTGGEGTSPGKEIVAKYTINNGTSLGSSIQIALEYYMGSEWFSLNSIVPDASGTGNISGTLPYMPLSSSLPVRVILVNTQSLGYRNTVIERNDPSDEVGAYTVAESSRFGFNIYGEVLEAVNAFVEYSTDLGTTWEVIGTKALTAGTKGFLLGYTADLFNVVDADLTPITGSVEFRINADKDDAVNAIILGHRLEQPFEMPEIKDQQNIRIINPSVTFSDMVVVNQELLTDDDEFSYNTDYSIKYTTRGLWPNDTYFAFAFVRNNKYMVLAESKLQGKQTLNFTVPAKEELEDFFGVTLGANETFSIRTFAYSRDAEFGGYNNLRLYLAAQAIHQVDIIEKSGTNTSGLFFYKNEERYAITRAYDLSNMAGPVYLNFYYTVSENITPATLQTLPRIQVSIDNGVTYTDLELSEESVSPAGNYTSLNRLEKTTTGWSNYSIELPSQYLKAETHFRWIQMVNRGKWEVYCSNNSSDPNITGADNELKFYDKLSGSQSIKLVSEVIECPDYDNSLADYTWTVVDGTIDPLLDPVAVAGQEFDFAFEYAELIPEPTFPVGTEFYFMLMNNDETTPGAGDNTPVVDPDTGEPVTYGPFVNVNDTILQTVLMPAFVETGVYSIFASASFINNETECNWPAVNVKNNLFVEGAEAHDAINVTLNNPKSGDTFKIEEAFDLTYSTLGTWPADVKFAAVVKAAIDSDGNERYKVLGESNITGVNKLIADIKMISNPWWFDDADPLLSDYISSYQLGIVAYQGNEFVLQNNVYGPLEEEDFIDIQGATKAINIYISQEGNRQLLTRAFDLTGLNNATLNFSYFASNITVSNSTLPQLLASIDGGVTFTPLTVDSEFGNLGFLGYNESGKVYSVEVPLELVTNATHFMWKQQVNGGAGKDSWAINNIKITAGSSSVYEGKQNFVNINVTWPRLSNYTWSISEVNGMEPTLFNGNTFDYSWSLNDGLDALPTGVKVEFFLWESGDYVIDPATSDTISLGVANATGDFEATLPFLIERKPYGVMAIATLNGEVYDQGIVKNINIFNNAIRATLVNPNPVIYAGNQIEVKGTVENATDMSTFDDVWFNLVLKKGTTEWLLDAKKGLGNNFAAILHPSISGPVSYSIKATIDNPMGTVGEPIKSGANLTFNNTHLDYTKAAYTAIQEFTLDNRGYVREIKTNNQSDNWDLTKQSSIEFKLKFEEQLSELTEDQKLVLAYSVDKGVTFTEIASYPDARFEDPLFFENEDLTDWFNEYIQIPEEAKTEETILRWRVEESNGFIKIKDVELTPFMDYLDAPLQSITNSLALVKQRIDLVANNLTTCPDGTIGFTYNIRGRFSEESILTIKSLGNTLKIDAKDIKFTGITNGTGEISLNLGLLDNPISGNDVKFRLEAKDFEFDEETSFSVTGLWTELGVEIIPNIEDFTPNIYAQTSGNTEYYSCNDEERIVVLTSVKEYFAYQLRNVNTGELIGDKIFVDSEDEILTDSDTYPYYNTGDNSLKISIGAISEHTVVEVIVTSHNAENSLTCQTYVPNGQAAFNTRDLAIQYKWTGSEIGAGYWKDVTGNENFTICEGSTNLSFRLYDYAEVNPVSAGITWYRNNTETPVVVGATLNNYPATGEYFVVYKHNKCSDYASDSIQITVAEIPTKPIITFEGSQEICEGESATLSTSDNYSYYKWYRFGIEIINATSNTIEVYEDGSYTVEVSNRAFDPNVSVCSSISDAYSVSLNIHIRPITPDFFTLIDGVLCEPGVAQVNLSIFENDVRYQLYDWQTKQPTGEAVLAGNQGSVILTSDVLTKDTKLGVLATRNNEQMCGSVYSRVFAEVTVHDLYIDVNGNTLIASINENNASTYQWYRNDRIINHGGTSRTLNIYDDAQYKVIVVTYDGCTIESSIGNGPAEKEPEKVTATTLSLFPNPARDIITVNFENADDETIRIRILNISGEVVFDKEVEKADSELRYEIPISKFNNGAYIVHVIGKQEVKVQQFIKF